MTCGETLESFLVSQPGPVTLAAPFIKVHVLERLLGLLEPARAVRIFTRWRAEEVAAGVSDLEVLNIVLSRKGTELLLCNALHAKYYRAGARVLIGSANLTGRALGWHPQPNLELLVASEWRAADFQSFEEALARESVHATLELQDLVRTAAAALPQSPPEPIRWSHPPEGDWLPVTRHPEQLFRAYKHELSQLTAAAREQTRSDLDWLSPPAGLNEQQFRAAIAATLLQAPLVAALLRLGEEPRRFGEVRAYLGRRFDEQGIERDSTEAWQTSLRWLLYFAPDRVAASVTNYSEIFATRAYVPSRT